MASTKIQNNIDTGLWTEYGDGYIAHATVVYDENGNEYGRLSYHKGRMPSHEREDFSNLDDLETAMRKVEPDLRKWRTTFEA